MNQEIEEIEDNNEIEIQENIEGYAQRITFSQESYKRIRGLELNAQHPTRSIFNHLANLVKREKIVVYDYQEAEKPVNFENAYGSVRITLLTKANRDRALSKIKDINKRNKIQYVYIGRIQFLLKSLFKEGINSPITLSLHDQRFKDAHRSHLGTVEGNLIYGKLLFDFYPKYSVSITDENLNETLNLHFKLLKDLRMGGKSKAFTIYYRALFAYSNSNYGKIYQDKPHLVIDDECREIAEAKLPLLEEIEDIASYNLEITHLPQLGEASSSKPQIEFSGNTLSRKANIPKQITYSKSQRPNTMIILGEYFNGRENVMGKILIDTGATMSHFSEERNKALVPYTTKEFIYKNFQGKMLKCNQGITLNIKFNNIKTTAHCYVDSNMSHEFYDIILGNNFLDKLTSYKIEKQGVTFEIGENQVFCPRIEEFDE